MDERKPVNRRRFFRESLRELLRPVVEAIEPIEAVAQQLGALEQPGATVSRKPAALQNIAWLRPPGALAEQEFRETCSRCGVCVEVCPAHCIKIDTTGAKGAGVPYIEPDIMPCVVCDSLACMNQCPSGALSPIPLAEINMGTAKWRPETCVRTTKGEQCTICIDHCPVGEVAIRLLEGKVDVIEDGCIGCGVCQHDCPTSPKSIVVVPRG
jgi:MauM/NapG family ferredoxin protein